MKSSILIILATLLATAILAPSVITLSCLDDKTTINLDFNDEEKKEERKEVKEKDFFINDSLLAQMYMQKEKSAMCSFYIESTYSTAIDIFLPPPEPIV